jgi:hypothetical protein
MTEAVERDPRFASIMALPPLQMAEWLNDEYRKVLYLANVQAELVRPYIDHLDDIRVVIIGKDKWGGTLFHILEKGQYALRIYTPMIEPKAPNEDSAVLERIRGFRFDLGAVARNLEGWSKASLELLPQSRSESVVSTYAFEVLCELARLADELVVICSLALAYVQARRT